MTVFLVSFRGDDGQTVVVKVKAIDAQSAAKITGRDVISVEVF